MRPDVLSGRSVSINMQPLTGLATSAVKVRPGESSLRAVLLNCVVFSLASVGAGFEPITQHYECKGHSTPTFNHPHQFAVRHHSLHILNIAISLSDSRAGAYYRAGSSR